MRFLLAGFLIAWLPVFGASTENDEVIRPNRLDDQITRLMAQQAQLIAVAEVEELPLMVSGVLVWVDYRYGFKLVTALRGEMPAGTSFTVRFSRVRDGLELPIKKGDRYIIFIRPYLNTADWDLVSNYHGIIPHSPLVESVISKGLSK
jgi:hypothetical protein